MPARPSPRGGFSWAPTPSCCATARSWENPRIAADAERMLKKLSGVPHEVVTGFAVFDKERKGASARRCGPRCTSSTLRDEEISSLHRHRLPLRQGGRLRHPGGAAHMVQQDRRLLHQRGRSSPVRGGGGAQGMGALLRKGGQVPVAENLRRSGSASPRRLCGPGAIPQRCGWSRSPRPSRRQAIAEARVRAADLRRELRPGTGRQGGGTSREISWHFIGTCRATRCARSPGWWT